MYFFICFIYLTRKSYKCRLKIIFNSIYGINFGFQSKNYKLNNFDICQLYHHLKVITNTLL